MTRAEIVLEHLLFKQAEDLYETFHENVAVRNQGEKRMKILGHFWLF